MLTIIVVILMIWYLNDNREIFTNLQLLRTQDLLIIAMLQPINIIIGAIINKMIFDGIDQKISFTDALLLQFANNFLNRFISEGGAVYRGAYLKTQFAFPISKFLASLGGVYIISLITNAIIGILLTFVIYLIEKVYNPFIIGLFTIMLLVTGSLLLIKPKFESTNWLLNRINQVINGWNRIKKNKNLIQKISLLSALSLLNSSLTVFIAYRGLGADIRILNSFFYSTISAMANIINLTPGGLGINEGILMFSSDVIGVTSEIVLLGALMLRAIGMITTLSFGGISYLILNYRLQKTNKSQ